MAEGQFQATALFASANLTRSAWTALHWRSCFGVRLQHFDIGRSVWLAEEFAILRLCCHFALVYLVERLDIMSTGHCD